MSRIVYIGSTALILIAAIAGFNGWRRPFTMDIPRLDAAQEKDSERLKELGRIIEQEIGTPAASQPSQCKVIAFGAKPCGGPAKYLVYSTEKTNEPRLKQLVNEFNQLAKKKNQEGNLVSDCMVVTEPKVNLDNGICTIGRN